MKLTCPLPRLWLGFTACLLAAIPAAHAGGDVKATYETGLPAINKISGELFSALDAKRRQQLVNKPVVVENATPWIAPVERAESGRTVQAVQISTGFVDLINYLSHARAIDEVDRGFFRKCSDSLTAATPLVVSASSAGSTVWSFDTMNHQTSHFNQMAGALIAIDMAHHYLGHYRKYAAQLAGHGGQPAPITSMITASEWKEAVLKGSRNALDCGLGIDGFKSLLESLDKMPARPAWAPYFVHAKADASKIRKELEKLEKNFFLAGD